MSNTIFFDVPHAYYVPQYAPVITELKSRGVDCLAVLHHGRDDDLKTHVMQELAIPHAWVDGEKELLALIATQRPVWTIFGNHLPHSNDWKGNTKTALLYHGSGTGTKRSSASEALVGFNVRFVSGPGRLPTFRQLYPDTVLVETGFAKLDPLRSESGRKQAALDLVALGLDPAKPTVLYAPTFYPSSIERMGENFPEDFSDYNLLIKGHDFTYNKSKYRHQLDKLERWAACDNVYFAPAEEFSLLPFMASADILVTDTSSAMYEFASLDKPVVLLEFTKVRWSYRGPLRYRLRRRLDPSTVHYQKCLKPAHSYRALRSIVDGQLANPGELASLRLECSRDIMGNMDGHAAKRVVDYLLENTA